MEGTRDIKNQSGGIGRSPVTWSGGRAGAKGEKGVEEQCERNNHKFHLKNAITKADSLNSNKHANQQNSQP